MALSVDQREEIENEFTKLVKNAFTRLRGINLEKQAINPFLAVFQASTPADLAEALVSQRLERSLVTSMGGRLQKIARIAGTTMQSSGVSGADLEGHDDSLKRHMLMQLKSGPDTVNKDIMESIDRNLQQAENRIKQGSLPQGWVVMRMLGMCYGQPRHRNNWVLGLGKRGFVVDHIGRDFWSFITNDEDAYKEIFAIALDVATTYKDSGGQTLPEATHDAVSSLTNQIASKYGDGKGGIDWAKLLDDNM